jgi:Cys-rich repeat protein
MFMRMAKQSGVGVLLLALALTQSGCGSDATEKSENGETKPGDGDGDGTPGGDGDGDGAGDGDGDQGEAPLLAADVVGKECAADTACGDTGKCVGELTGGASTAALGVPPMAAPGGYCTAACTSSAQCGEGGVCFGAVGGAGECRKGCSQQADCRDGYECAVQHVQVGFEIPSTCQSLPTPDKLSDNQAGKLCKGDADCGSGSCRGASEQNDGVCTGVCIADADCGAGGICIPGIYGAAGTCSESCENDTDCQNAGSGWGCPAEGERKVCQRQLADGAVGKACTAASEAVDCPGGSCREQAFQVVYTGGYCIGACSTDAECGPGGVCIDGRTCLKGCAGQADCREGYGCMNHPLATTTTDVTVCYPNAPDDAGAGG